MSTTTPHIAPPPAQTAPEWAPLGRTVALLTVAGILMVGQLYAAIALVAPMAETFGSPARHVTWMVTAFGFGYALAFLVAGPLADRFGARPVICIGLVATCVTTALVALAPTLSAGIALRVLQGVTAASFGPASFAYIAEHIEPRRRPLALTCVISGFLSAAVLMQVAAQLITTTLNWQAVFLGCAPLLLLAAGAARTMLRPSRGAAATSFGSAFAAMPRLLARPRLLALYGATLTLLGGFVAIYTAVTLAGPDSVSGDTGALLVLKTTALPAMIAVPLATPLLTRVPVHTRLVTSLVLATLAAVAAARLGGNVVALATVLLVFVAAIATTAPALVESIGNAAGNAHGAALALYAFAMFCGASLGPQLVTALHGRSFGTLMLTVAVVMAVGALLALTTRPHSR